MTVQEVLEKMIGAYRGFDSAAVAAMQGVFQQKLEKYEGKELANAWIEVAASFRRTAATPYPMPSDFENVLPRAAKMPKGGAGPVLDRAAHTRRKAELVTGWTESQRPEIAEKYGPRVAFWCESEVRSRADTLAWDKDGAASITLSAADVVRIFESVVSRDRMDAYGAWPIGRLSAPEWQQQMEICRAHVLAGRHSRDEIALPVERKRPGVPARSVTVEGEYVEVGPVPSWVDDGAPMADAVPE